MTTAVYIHLDSFPVCGTTTTLDSLAIGIPVLTCPNNLYAGLFLLQLSNMQVLRIGLLKIRTIKIKARTLVSTYFSATSRLSLAKQIRSSSLCDTVNTPKTFSSK